MKLYLLKRIEHSGYDEAAGFVVRAKSPRAARKIIAGGWHGRPGTLLPWSGAEGDQTWLDPKRSTCRVLTTDGKPGVVLRDFLHG